jgi:hypothetical protein
MGSPTEPSTLNDDMSLALTSASLPMDMSDRMTVGAV